MSILNVRIYCDTRYGSSSSTTVMNALGFLSWILSGAMTGGQNVRCDRRTYVQPDTEDMFSYTYRGLTSYTWCFTTARDYEVTLNCPEVQMTKFTGYCRDTLNVTTTRNIRDGRVYCDPFQVRGSTVIMKLFSMDGRGNFKCYFKSRRIGNCECGYRGDSRMKITQGTPAGPHEFPSMAGLIDAQARMVRCGAFLIQERLALTAAHCVVNLETFQPLDANNYGLLVGAYQISQAGNTSSAMLYRIRRFVPNTNFRNQGFYDIALIETTITMWFGKNVGPACLPYKFSEHLYGEDVIIAGWGHTEFGGSESDVLLKGVVKIQNDNSCENVPAYNGRYSRETMICTLDDGTDQCQHDSGGPVYYIDPNTGLYFGLAVTNGGVGCGGKFPSYSARVFSYLGWISANYPNAPFCVVP
uniref:Venom serine protease 34 n=1 Tax=Lygus hesperus TaxID=30085 RepID=A0A146M174_LYGHE